MPLFLHIIIIVLGGNLIRGFSLSGRGGEWAAIRAEIGRENKVNHETVLGKMVFGDQLSCKHM